MSVHRIVLSEKVGHRIASALAGAAVIGGLVLQLANSFADSGALNEPAVIGETVSAGPRETIATPAPRELPELRARTDMRAYAIRKDLVVESENAFTVRPEWDWLWSLYFVDMHTGEEVVRVYEAVSRIEPDRRFTAMWHQGASAPTDWELVLD